MSAQLMPLKKIQLNQKIVIGNEDHLTMEEKMLRRVSIVLHVDKTKTLSVKQRKFIQSCILKYKLPDCLRREVWLRGSGAKTLMNDNPGYYERLLKDVPHYPNPCFFQVELDLLRTFSTKDAVYSRNIEEKMRRVLGAYIKRNPTVGYCQGLNFIVAILLNKLEEEETFWVFCQLIETMLPVDYYT